ncbi:hypothetical protein UFOVP276_89 [uncultured Caudovirales phage]|uniref:DUF932 domain-containing protein n=1 Tax=uncultured Caudovirales phage TaxID=2100421 RepID=A0A6J5LPI5_9CAUD|nr:hypothetical protein UFOVP127_226 [uncultured Caudovirales phage]CAB4135133.1 hypothetical protein UFOVP276_89 [uncultured Caudovirales phage]
MNGLRLEDTKKLIKFETVRQEVAEEHDLKNPDVVVKMSDIQINEKLNMDIPGVGTYSITNWAKTQLGQSLGVTWDKWFNPKLVNHAQIQEEIQRRFSHSGESKKLRTKKFRPGTPGLKEADGYLRAVLSPTYAPIDDELIFDRCERRFSSELSNLGFMKGHFNRHEQWGNDHCNYYTLVAKNPIDLGPLDRGHANPEVRRIYDLAEREGKLPSSDLVYPGLTMRNSEVGYTAVIIDEFSFRLICLNGAIMSVGESRLLYRQHRPIEEALLDKQLTEVFANIDQKWVSTGNKLKLLSSIPVHNVEKEIEAQLTKLEASKVFIKTAQEAYKLEPLDNMYGVLQAITRAAQNINEDMDKRVDIEDMAGRFITMAPKLTALVAAAA